MSRVRVYILAKPERATCRFPRRRRSSFSTAPTSALRAHLNIQLDTLVIIETKQQKHTSIMKRTLPHVPNSWRTSKVVADHAKTLFPSLSRAVQCGGFIFWKRDPLSIFLYEHMIPDCTNRLHTQRQSIFSASPIKMAKMQKFYCDGRRVFRETNKHVW